MIQSARDALKAVYFCKLFHEYGKLERLDNRCLVDSDNWCYLVHEGVQCVCDFVAMGGGDGFETKIYFSDPPMLEYYRLCRDYCQIYGVSLKNNPFVKQAEAYVNEMLYYNINGSVDYGWTLHTRINHARASGILFAFSSDYFGYYPLLELTEVMLEIFRYYETELVALKKTIEARKNEKTVRKAA